MLDMALFVGDNELFSLLVCIFGNKNIIGVRKWLAIGWEICIDALCLFFWFRAFANFFKI